MKTYQLHMNKNQFTGHNIFFKWIIHITLVTLLLDTPIHTYAAPPVSLHPRFELRSNKPFQAVHIPFTLQKGAIMVKAQLAGKWIECELDTGSPMITWYKRLNLPGHKTGQFGLLVDGGGNLAIAEAIVLSKLYLGEYKLYDVTCYAMSTGRSRDNKIASSIQNIPLLGNTTFAEIVRV